MSNIYEIPAPDAPASEWGTLAVRIPGWQCRPDLIGWAAYRVDPDHWAWEGWLLKLLGPYAQHLECRVRTSGEVVWRACTGIMTGHQQMQVVITAWLSFGRACIAAAAANGRWPGGEG